ncbi:DUF2914 domain-containing protein, partial [Myxococcota bacterium]|nr:DUF2914 domain-containing protein [Myxococcota bacterium]
VPLDTLDAATARDVADREPRGRAEAFDAGTERVWAWFAIAAPEAYGEKVRFVWIRDGEEAPGTVETAIVGGRRTGFRTWAYKTRPERGAWTVELRATSGQLIARRSFVVR